MIAVIVIVVIVLVCVIGEIVLNRSERKTDSRITLWERWKLFWLLNSQKVITGIVVGVLAIAVILAFTIPQIRKNREEKARVEKMEQDAKLYVAERTPGPRLPDSEIMFQNIPWLTNEKDAVMMIRDAFPAITDEKEELRPSTSIGGAKTLSRSFADPEGKVFPSYESDAVRTKTIAFEADKGSLGAIAGHNLRSLELFFLSRKGVYSLYMAEAVFEDYDAQVRDASNIEMFKDLQDKLIRIYGKPVESYTVDNGTSLNPKMEAIEVWKAGDGTGIVLEYHTFYSDYFHEMLDYVVLKYGESAVSTGVFEEDARRQEAAEKKRQQEEQDKKDDIESDDSGL